MFGNHLPQAHDQLQREQRHWFRQKYPLQENDQSNDLFAQEHPSDHLQSISLPYEV